MVRFCFFRDAKNSGGELNETLGTICNPKSIRVVLTNDDCNHA
jgi:hypothetical protein